MTEIDDLTLLTAIAQVVYDKKGFNTLVLDVRAFSSLADYFVIAEGRVDRHIQALTRAIVDRLAELGSHPLHLEGKRVGEWVVIDLGGIVIHLLTPRLRERYDLEALWRQGTIVDLQIVLGQQVDEEGFFT